MGGELSETSPELTNIFSIWSICGWRKGWRQMTHFHGKICPKWAGQRGTPSSLSDAIHRVGFKSKFGNLVIALPHSHANHCRPHSSSCLLELESLGGYGRRCLMSGLVVEPQLWACSSSFTNTKHALNKKKDIKNRKLFSKRWNIYTVWRRAEWERGGRKENGRKCVAQ